MNQDIIRASFEKDFAKYKEQWSDAEFPLSQPEIDAYKAGYYDGQARQGDEVLTITVSQDTNILNPQDFKEIRIKVANQ